jgi:enoyl-CoA hydratase/carnithine racemase
MGYAGYSTLRVEIDAGVAFVTIDHPPINLFDLEMLTDMDRLGRELAEDSTVRVVVFSSADQEFFIAHADVALIEQLPTTVDEARTELGFFHAMVDRFRTLPQATIAKIEGRTRGGGSELVLSLDMRFAAIGRAMLAQPEVALGIIPGGSGTQRLPRLVGRGRALEIVLGCEDLSAELAERYGYVNRALPADEIGPFVDRLARRIAGFPAHAIRLAKEAVAAAEPSPVPGLLLEDRCFTRSLGEPETRHRMRTFLQSGGQTREIELDLATLIQKLAPPKAI